MQKVLRCVQPSTSRVLVSGGVVRTERPESFSLVAKRRIIPYHKGIERNYAKILTEKLDDPSKHDLLTEEEHKLLNGIEVMKQDQNLAKADREG